jgi:hypothetical protein
MPERFGRNGFTGHFVSAGAHLEDAADDTAREGALSNHSQTDRRHPDDLSAELGMEKARKRLRYEIGLAIISGLLFFVTLMSNEWIEVVFGVNPDNGDGSLEWFITLFAAIIAVIAVVLVRSDWRRLRAAEDGAK